MMIRSIKAFVGDYFFLSNFAPCAHLPPTLEHHFQAAKAMNAESRQLILSARTPSEAKRFGKRVPIRPDWDNVRVEVMRNLLLAKFRVEPFRSLLLETGNAPLIEGNDWGDRFWGVCRGVGENHLGRLLTEVRESIRK